MTLPRIDIQFIPAAEMRVPGWGDWYYEGDTLHIRSVSDDPDCDPFLVAFHELAEAWLCRLRGISAADVDAHDAIFNHEQDKGDEDGNILHEEDEEAGDDPRAPYRLEHRQAMLIEHMMAHFMGLTDYGVVR